MASQQEVAAAVGQRSELGESPIWSSDENALYWVDSTGRFLFRKAEDSGEIGTWSFDDEIGAVALGRSQTVIVATGQQICRFNWSTGQRTKLGDPLKNKSSVQFNDCKCDRAGRFWAGTMDRDELLPRGGLYRVEPDASASLVLGGIITANGLGWSPDGATMYHTDTWRRTITAFDFDVTTGTLENGRVFARDDTDAGLPDGLAVDSEGCVWSAKWDGWRVVRYCPDGAIDRVLEVPVARPTSCCFGGPNLDRLYITTARHGLGSAALTTQPLAGCVLLADPGVRGLPEPVFDQASGSDR